MALFIILAVLGGVTTSIANAGDPSKTGDLAVIFAPSGQEAPQEVARWDAESLSKMRKMTLKLGQGPLINAIVDKSLEKMTSDRRAQVDLLVIRAASGREVQIPRVVAVKHRLILAQKSDGKLASLGEWSPREPEASHEGLSLDAMSLSDVREIRLENYRNRHGRLFLRNQSDPIAVRGQYLFIRGCAGCHDSVKAPAASELTTPARLQAWSSGKHPDADGVPVLSDKSRRYLLSYLQAYQSEATLAGH